MALFESYERRIDQINAVLNSYGISSIVEAEKIQKMLDLMFTSRLRKSSQSVLRTLAGHTLQVQRSRLKKDARELLMLLQQSVKVFRHSVFQVLLLTTEKQVLDMVTQERCYLKKKQNVSHSLQDTNHSQLLKVLSVSQKRLTRFVRNL